jgi:hypothetical protein
MVRVSFTILLTLMAGSALALPQIQGGEIFSVTSSTNIAAPTSGSNPQSTEGAKPTSIKLSASDISAAPVTTSAPPSPELVPIPGADNSTLVAARPGLKDTVDQGNVIAGKIAANSTVKTRDLNSFSKRQLTCGNGIVSLDQFIWLMAANRFCDTEFPDPNIVYWIPCGAVITMSFGLPGGFSMTITLSVSTPCSFPFYEPITQATCNAYFANSIDAMSQDCLFDNGWQDTSPVLQPPFYPFDTDGTIS